MKFNELKTNFSLPKAEEEILAFWEAEDIFHKTNEMSHDRPRFIFYEGPPTANGRPGIHHVISRTVKDLVCRYKTMRGYRVDRKAGWDTHGLPVEIEVEKRLKLDSKAKIVEYGIAKFNEECKKSVFTYLEEWNQITKRIGYWLDLDDAYVTLKNDYIETVWWILKNFFDRDLIYKGFRTVPFCPRCETGLSSHEVAQGYQMIKDPSIYVKVKAADDDFSYLVWTTTPWTLPSNAALCMKAEAEYVMIEHEGEKLVLAEALVEKVMGEPKTALARYKGSDFLKRKYIPLFDTYQSESDKAFYLINGEFVTLDEGTGIVHIAPGFGADDYEVGRQNDLPMFQAIYNNGHFKEIAGPYAGMFIKDADPLIIKDLKIAGRMFKKEKYEHNYPFCWRCDSPLIYIARKSWYLKTTQFKDQLLKNNNAINWYPDEIRSGRMLNWLENNVDWSLSRERFWGTPIPIWVCDTKTCGLQKAIGSIDEMINEAIDSGQDLFTSNKNTLVAEDAEDASEEGCPAYGKKELKNFIAGGKLDLHKPMMDHVKLTCKCGGTMSRIPEVVDVWFDSGAMPFAQWHYPFENKDEFESRYPADFISEAVDQTRGWFYSLLAISTLLFDKVPFKNVIVLEFILDKKGKKMSKHKGNVVDPFATVDKYGADPVRWYMVSTSNPWLPTRFSLDGLAEVVRKFFDTLRNTYSFFALYANIDDIPDKSKAAGQRIENYLADKAGPAETFDKWIVSKYNSLVKEVVLSFDAYEITKPVRAIQFFVIEELSNWYVRNNRRRFWAKGDDPSKMRAYLTLYQTLAGICRLIAPVSPMVSELIWKELMGENRIENGLPMSVHMTEFPSADETLIDPDLEQTMGMVEKIVSLGRAARSRKNLKIRQPLSKILISLPDKIKLTQLDGYLSIIKDELNIKEVAGTDDLDRYINYSAKLNFKVAGSKLGSGVKSAATALNALSSEAVKEFVSTGQLLVDCDGEKVSLATEDVTVVRDEKEGFAIEADNGVTVALVTVLTEELIDEGFARELVNKIQFDRKERGFNVTDNIRINWYTPDQTLKKAADRYKNWICEETLAHSMDLGDESLKSEAGSKDLKINNVPATIMITKI